MSNFSGAHHFDTSPFVSHIYKKVPEPFISDSGTLLLCFRMDYPPKLSYMIDAGSTPNESSICTTALDIGPGPHM